MLENTEVKIFCKPVTRDQTVFGPLPGRKRKGCVCDFFPEVSKDVKLLSPVGAYVTVFFVGTTVSASFVSK